MNISKYFKTEEFKCKCGICDSTGNEMNPIFISRLNDLREIVGFPLIVSSGYRCPKYNNKVSTTGEKGPHTTGKAVDFSVNGENAYHVLRTALEIGFSGVGIKQNGISRFIHLDILTEREGYPRPRVWSY
jgi:zinc D-Ala-D-Ala carboxypeptidase